MKKKARYKILNWADYNKSLINRGSLTFWFSEDAVKKWKSTKQTKAKGRPEIYSDEALLCALILREIYHLPLRGLQGFIASLFILLKISLPVPSYSQISRRCQRLNKQLLVLSKGKAKDIVFDSTGLKVYGEGEWKVKKHGVGKRRTWRKLHIGLDPHTQDILISELTSNGEDDAEVGVRFLDEIPGIIAHVWGDGAYDDQKFRKKVSLKGGKSLVPPPRNGTYKGTSEEWQQQRDHSILEILGLGGEEEGRKLWKKLTGYHKRSLVETAFSRIKRLFGPHLKAKVFCNQKVESQIKCLIINKMNCLGLPESELILKNAA